MAKSCTPAIVRNCKMLTVFVLSFIFISVTNSFGQLGVGLGAKGGIGITTFKGSNVSNIDERTSWLGGAFLNAQITPAFNLQPEILFSQKGADYTTDGLRRSLVINYFEIPVLAKFRLPVGEVFFPHILLGPNFAFRTNLKYSGFETGSGTPVSMNESEIRKSDVGAILGAGVDIETRYSGVFFTVDGRYGFGFNNLDRSDNSVEIKNAGWSFAVGIGFILKQ
jgi:Outer membrane protein beta-barrel domain